MREVVKPFYADFNSHGWTHAQLVRRLKTGRISTRSADGRAGETPRLKELEEVNSTFLKVSPIRIEDMALRFATRMSVSLPSPAA
jgi:hypothetical protein